MSSHSGGMGIASSQEDCVRKYDARNSISSGHAKQLQLSYYFKLRYNGPNKRYFLLPFVCWQPNSYLLELSEL